MACMTIFATSMTMATNEFTRAVRQEYVTPRQMEYAAEHLPLRMNWVVDIDNEGAARLHMQWSRDC